LQNWANEIMRQTGSRKPVCVAAGLSGVDTKGKHYFGRFTHAAACCKSIFGNAGNAALVAGR
jgi:hypothetical protein